MNLWTDYKRSPLPDLLSFIVDNRGKTVPTTEDGEHKLIATNCIRNENLYPSYEDAKYIPTDSSDSPGLAGGISYLELMQE